MGDAKQVATINDEWSNALAATENLNGEGKVEGLTIKDALGPGRSSAAQRLRTAQDPGGWRRPLDRPRERRATGNV